MNAEIWLRQIEGGAMRAGISAALAESLGAAVVAVELAPPGTRLRAGDTFGFVQTAKRTVDLRAPAAMRVLRVNEAVLKEPRLVEAACEERGWLIEAETDAPAD